MLKYALWVLFCISSPLYSAHGQWPGLIWDVYARQPPAPSSKKKLECPSENRIPHPNRSFFLREFLVTRRCAAALAFPVLLVDEKEPTIHGDCLTIFLKKYIPRLPCTTCVVSEQSIFRSLALAQDCTVKGELQNLRSTQQFSQNGGPLVK